MRQFFIIRRIDDGFVMPALRDGLGHGHTYSVPVDPKVVVPRLFIDRTTAIGSLRQWCRGKHQRMDRDYSDVTVTPVVGRNFNDFEIVPVSINVVSRVELI